MEQFYQNILAPRCSRLKVTDTKWHHHINLTCMPTKVEDFNLKLDNSNILFVSGKSEISREEPNGLNIFSTHNWSKQIKIPENVDQATLSARMFQDMNKRILTISADRTKEQIQETSKEHEHDIPIERKPIQ